MSVTPICQVSTLGGYVVHVQHGRQPGKQARAGFWLMAGMLLYLTGATNHRRLVLTATCALLVEAWQLGRFGNWSRAGNLGTGQPLWRCGRGGGMDDNVGDIPDEARDSGHGDPVQDRPVEPAPMEPNGGR